MPAPKGNTNSLKHGLYAKQFNEDQRAGLKRMQWDDYRHEIFVSRVAGAGVFKKLQSILSSPEVDLDQLVKAVNLLAVAFIAAGTSARTHANLNDSEEAFGDALSLALGDVPFDLVEKYNGT